MKGEKVPVIQNMQAITTSKSIQIAKTFIARGLIVDATQYDNINDMGNTSARKEKPEIGHINTVESNKIEQKANNDLSIDCVFLKIKGISNKIAAFVTNPVETKKRMHPARHQPSCW